MNNDLISRSAPLEVIPEAVADEASNQNEIAYAEGWNDCLESFCSIVKYAPAVDAVEVVRHGRWIPNKVGAVETKFECSECGRTVILGNDYFAKATKYASHRFPYCHCGCKMDAEVEDART